MNASRKRNLAGYVDMKTLPIHISGFLDLFGVSMILPLILSHARETGASTTLVGVLGSCYGAMQIFSSPMIGQWSDQIGHRFVLLVCLLCSCFGYGLFALGTSLTMMFIARIPLGIFKHSLSIGKAYLTDITHQDDRSATLGRFSAAASLGFIVGPAVGGHIAELPGGFYWVALMTSAIFFINFVIIWLFVTPEQPSSRKIRRNLSTVASLKNLQSDEINTTSNPWNLVEAIRKVDWTDLWDLFLIKFLLGLSVIVLRSNYTLMLIQRFETTHTMNGYIISFNAIMSALAGFCVGWISKRYNSSTTLILHIAYLQIITLAVLSYAPSLWIFISALIPLGLCTTVGRVALLNLTILRGGSHETGALMGFSQSMMSIARMVAPLLAGLVQELSPSGPGLLGVVFSCLAVLVLLVRPQDPSDRKKKFE